MSDGNGNSEETFSQYDEAVQWINSLIPFGIRPGLKRMELFMERLDHPERRLKFIHVAGTNGKGSTCAYLTNVLIQGGYTVGTFTSPYISKFTNRIQTNNQDISEEDLLLIANQLKPLADEIAATELGSPTMFEVTTTMAILYFAKFSYPDFVVMETGMGGRLDCTNVITPLVSAITNVGHDHMEILGDTLAKVAFEKAGIIKSGVPIVSAVEQDETIEVLKSVALEKKSTLYLLGREFHYEPVSLEENAQSLRFSGPFRTLQNVGISLNGAHQLKNAAVALMVLEVLRQYYAVIVDDEELLQGFKTTAWPGRLEMISVSPRILLDGAHNPEGAETLALALKQVYRYKKVHLMIGMLATKNHPGYLRHILPIVDTLVITEPDFRRKMDAAEFAKVVDSMVLQLCIQPIEMFIEPDWKKALEQLKTITGPDDLAVVSGTLYLIADVRSWLLYQSNSEKGW